MEVANDWETMERLHAKGYISDPRSTAKSVVFSEDGERRARELFERHFGVERLSADHPPRIVRNWCAKGPYCRQTGSKVTRCAFPRTYPAIGK